ncbi:hypothetical protein Amn_pc00790 (plasmid) [Aminobacter sp. Y103A]|nr:hypothetical protein Amn_pc00790 [Aminobacter sp. SS-2016]BCH20083.1 hypothetical protein MesoLjLa_69340 [Mesorhizobium sp. L-2-11]
MQAICVIGSIDHNDFGGQAVAQGMGLQAITLWPAVKVKRTGQPDL